MKITIIDVTESDLGVRKIPMNYRSVTGRVEMLNGDSVSVESPLERDFCHVLDYDGLASKVVSQPLRIKFKVGVDPAVRRYTPDFLVRYGKVDGMTPPRPCLYEVKLQSDLLEQYDQLAPGFEAAKMLCRQRGWDFEIATDHSIRNVYQQNVEFLRDYRTYPDTGVHSQMLLKTMEELKISTPAELLAATFMDMQHRMEAVGVLWRLITNRTIGVSLLCKLTMTSEIWHEQPLLYGPPR